MNFKRLIYTLLFLITGFSSEATHIVGGELYYTTLGNNQYRIHLTMYRDCYFGVPPFDNPAIIGIWDANNTLIQYINLPVLADSILLDPIILSPCFIPPTDVCYRKANYSGVVTLPPRVGGYQLAYQRCCRNQTILNIVNPLDVGATFYASIPGSNLQTPSSPAFLNSNPVFDSLPPLFVCANLQFVFNHSATDAEGDSLAYELCVPYNGASLGAPVLFWNPPTTNVNHIENFSPPYNNVIFQPPFNITNLLGGVPLSINSSTGLLTATPNTIGQFVIGICVKEYRDGVLLSRTRRDFQLNVKACPTLVVAALITPVLTCGSNTVQFTNNSFGASSYFWDFGDTSTLADTSLSTNPSYTYPALGTYNVTLIAYSTFNPGCSDTTTGTVTIAPDYEIDFNFTQSACSYIIQFNDTSNSLSGVTTGWIWNYGHGGPVDTISDPTHTFPGPGTYTVTLNATSAMGCKETLVKTVIIPPFVSVTATNGQVTCNGLCTGQSTSNVSNAIPPVTYLWNDPQAQTTVTATGLCPGTYTVTVTDSSGCTSTATSIITEPAQLSAAISATEAYCDGLCIGTATVGAAGGTLPYSIQWNDPNSQTGSTATGLCPGFYTATISDAQGCTTVALTVEVLYSTYIPPLDAVISSDTVFIGQSVTLNASSTGNFTYSWTPVLGLSSSTVQSPSVSPTQNTTWYVTITDAFGCSNLDSVSVVVKEVFCIEPEIFIPSAFTPNNDQSNDLFIVRGNTIRELEFKVFDRWGEKVFETNEPGKGWDGSYKGKIASPAVYVYYVEAVCYNNERFFKKGNVTLIR